MLQVQWLLGIVNEKSDDCVMNQKDSIGQP
jgi:hypothetical protein